MTDIIIKRDVGIAFLLLCAGMLLTLSTPASAQGYQGYVGYWFDGTTTCFNENRGPDSTLSGVLSGDPMCRTGTSGGLEPLPPDGVYHAGPNCTSTTGSNNSYNSKDWSPLLQADYLALLPDNVELTYVYWGFKMLPDHYINPPGLLVHFTGKRNGNGPSGGFLEVRLHHKTTGWTTWAIMTSHNAWHTGNYWVINNSSLKEFRYTFDIGDWFVYDEAQIRIHGYANTGSGGQGDGFQIDGLWTLGTDDPSPVQLVSFTSALNGGKVDLKWKTATEINNYGFEVQRSTDSKNWNAIGLVEGMGTVNTPQSYSYSDPLTPDLLKAPTLYYRLRQIDRDGRQDFSPIVQVSTRIATGVRLLGNYPNPFNPSTTILFSLDQKQPVSLIVYDLRGAEVARLVNNETLEAGVHSILFLPASLASGTYLYTLSTQGMNLHSLMQIMK